MKIITLTETQFKNYSKLHSSRNYFQTIEYANMSESYQKDYLGFINEGNNTIMAATVVLTKKIGIFNIGYVPGGFLIDYEDETLLRDFTIEIKNYFKAKKYIYLNMNCRSIYKIFDKEKNIIYFDTDIIKIFDKLGYIKLKKENYPEVILKTEKTPNETFKNFNHNTKHNIKLALQKAITIYQESLDNYQKIFEELDYNDNKIKKIINNFKGENNTAELYIAKINPEKYINNYRFLLKEEEEINERLNEIMKNVNIKKTISVINKKMESDKTITKYNNEIIKATNLYTKYPSEVTIGFLLIIKNNREIYFLNEGCSKELKSFYSSHLIKWEIIKKYLNEGYKIFNLGPSNNKGNYNFKMGFGANLYEYVGNYDLVINKWLYYPVKIIKKLLRK